MGGFIENVEMGVLATVIGMGVVFSVLIFLSIIMSLLTKVLDSSEKKSKAPAAPKAPAAGSIEIAVNEAPQAPQQGISPKVIAAIMVAISASTGYAVSNLKFTSIKKANTVNPQWAKSSTAEIINTRKAYLNN